LHPIRHDHYGARGEARLPFLPSKSSAIWEIPVGTIEILGIRFSCAGGGFFRLLPYLWTAKNIEVVNTKESRPVTFYFHPWELDPAQPRFRHVPLTTRLRHYVNLSQMEMKLKRLMAEFRWSRIDHVYAAQIESTKGPSPEEAIGDSQV